MRNIGRKSDLKAILTRIGILLFVLIAASAVFASFSGSEVDSFTNRSDENKTFFTQFIIAGGPIVWFILLPTSVLTVYLAIDNGILIRRSRLLPVDADTDIADIAKISTIRQLIEKISDREDLLSQTLCSALARFEHKSDIEKINNIAADFLESKAIDLMRKTEWFNIIGNVAPMVGLFGTVFGMIKAFNILGVAGGQPHPDQLAAAISIALVTTFWGLLIAIPALTMYGLFRTRIESLINQTALKTEALIDEVLSLTLRESPDDSISHTAQSRPVSGYIERRAILSSKDSLRQAPAVRSYIKKTPVNTK